MPRFDSGYTGGMSEPLSDTHPEIERMLLERLREMSGARKLELLAALNQAVRDLQLSELRARFPGAPPDELRRRLADRILGIDLAARVYGPCETADKEP